MNPFLSVYGHVTIDQIMEVRKFPLDNTTEDVVTSSTSLGGTGANIAVAAARLGCPTALCAFVGADFPDAYEKIMRDSGLMMDDFVRADGYDSSKAIVVNDRDMVQKVLFYQGPQGFAEDTGIMLTDMASRSRFVHFCTGQPSYYIKAMKQLPDAYISLDPAQESHRIWNSGNFPEALELSDALFCNAIEARSLAKYIGKDSIFDAETDMVVCTHGTEGSRVRMGDEIIGIPAVRAARTVDVTGAGDTYRAGFYASLYRGYPIPEALVIAASAASFAVEKTGALTNTPTWEAALERAEPYFGEISGC